MAAARHATTTGWPPQPRRYRAWARECSPRCSAHRWTSPRLACRCRPWAGATCGTAACWVHCRPSSGRRVSPAGSAALHPPSAPSQSSGPSTSHAMTRPRRRSSRRPALTACLKVPLLAAGRAATAPEAHPPARSALVAALRAREAGAPSLLGCRPGGGGGALLPWPTPLISLPLAMQAYRRPRHSSTVARRR